jgi:hypothetical protein
MPSTLNEFLENALKGQKLSEVASEDDVMKPFKDKAEKAMSDMVKNAIAGYGKGNAIRHIVDVLQSALPKDLHGFVIAKQNTKKIKW